MTGSVFAQLNNQLPPLIPGAQPSVFAPANDPTLPTSEEAPKPKADSLAPVAKAAPAAKPSVFAPPPYEGKDTQGEISQNLQRRLQSDYQKDLSPYGSANNHPGFWGKVAHGLSVATGQPGWRNYEEQGLEKRVEDLGKLQSEEGLQGSTAAKQTEETSEMPEKTATEETESGARTKNLESETRDRDQAAQQGPSLAQAYAHAVQQALSKGQDPAQDPVVQHLSDAITSLQPGQNKPEGAAKTETYIPPGGKTPITFQWNEKTSKYDIPLGQHYERPITINTGNAELDREATRLTKPYQTALTAGQAQLDKIDEAESMITGNAEAQALGVPKVLTALVSGQGSGVRITMPELQAIAKARGLQGDVEGTLRKWSGEGALTHEQQSQLHGILEDAKARIQQKLQIHSDALDQMNGARSRDDIVRTDHDARQKLNSLEQGGGGAQKTIVQHSASTNQYRYSTDGGKTWQSGQPPSQPQ